MVLKGGTAMSKSKGNIVDPEEMVDEVRGGHVPPVRVVRGAARRRTWSGRNPR
jgi:valyl-tRNA synthetase